MRRAIKVLAPIVIVFILLAFAAALWPTEHHWDPDNEFRSRFTGHWQYFEANPRQRLHELPGEPFGF